MWSSPVGTRARLMQQVGRLISVPCFLFELILVVKLHRCVTDSKGLSVMTGLVAAIATYHHLRILNSGIGGFSAAQTKGTGDDVERLLQKMIWFLIELILVIMLTREVTVSKGLSFITCLVTAIATYLQSAGKAKIRKLYPSKRRKPKNYTVPFQVVVMATSFGG